MKPSVKVSAGALEAVATWRANSEAAYASDPARRASYDLGAATSKIERVLSGQCGRVSASVRAELERAYLLLCEPDAS